MSQTLSTVIIHFLSFIGHEDVEYFQEKFKMEFVSVDLRLIFNNVKKESTRSALLSG